MARLVLGQKEAALEDYRQALLLNPPPGALQSVIAGLRFLEANEGRTVIPRLLEVVSWFEQAWREARPRDAHPTGG